MESRGEIIRRRRKELGLTQTELATDAGVSRNVIANLELNRKGSPSYVLRKVARAAGIEYESLASE